MNRLLIPMLLLLASACKTAAPAVPAASSGALALVYRQPSSIDGSAGNVQVEFSDLEDSRCPTSGQCFWAGEARITLTVTEAGAALQQVRLGLSPGPKQATSLPDSLRIVLRQQPYWVRLLTVAPYPSLNGTLGPKVATVRLRPQ